MLKARVHLPVPTRSDERTELLPRRHHPSLHVEGELSDDADLRRLVRVIVRDFKGDTSAFFDSIGRGPAHQADEVDARESKIVRRFAKSI